MSNLGSKKSGGPDPTHESFAGSIKGYTSPFVDLDMITTEYWQVTVSAEEGSKISAHAIEQTEPDSDPLISFSSTFDLEERLTPSSISISRPKQANPPLLSFAQYRSEPLMFFVAVACLEYRQVRIYQLTLKQGAFTLSPIQNTIQHVHTKPCCKVRLSSSYPRLLVTCGDQDDCQLKVFNISKSDSEPLGKISTS